MHYYNEFDRHAAGWLRELTGEAIPSGYVDDRSITEVVPDDLFFYTYGTSDSCNIRLCSGSDWLSSPAHTMRFCSGSTMASLDHPDAGATLYTRFCDHRMDWPEYHEVIFGLI